MFFRRKKVRTHAVALWSLVGACVVLLLVMIGYIIIATKIDSGTMRSKPARGAADAPSLFGTVLGISGEGVLTIDSKQPFNTVLVDELTTTSAIGGLPFQASDLRPGAIMTATGKDIGNRTLRADALVVISNPGTPMQNIGAPTDEQESSDNGRQLSAPFKLIRNDGSRTSVITPTATSTWWLSTDGKSLLNVETSAKGKKTTTTFDLTTRHIQE